MHIDETGKIIESIGNKTLDSEHEILCNIIDSIAHSFAERNTIALQEEFEELENGLRAYFVIEENIAQAVSYDFTHHRLAHQDLLVKFQHLKDELMSNACMRSKFGYEYCISVLINPLFRHIKLDDKPLKVELRNHFYDFNCVRNLRLDSSPYQRV